ncbi:MAG TPA: aldo/keto reductase [Nitratifractor sp.]|nr:aldo/keto reductase [Nitratifractor sp.]
MKTQTMSAVIYGTAWKKEMTAEYVKQAVRAGFRAIDTACQPKHYREDLVGEGIEQSGVARQELYIQTKFTPVEGQDPKSIPYDKSAPLARQVEQSFTRSQKNLATEYIDALILHSPLFPFARLMEVWHAMERIKASGSVGAIGISNCYDLRVLQRLSAEAEFAPSIVQNRFYAQSDYDKALRVWLQEQGVVYQSFWSLTANPHVLADKRVIDIATKRDKSPAQIFFAYLQSQGIHPLSGTTSLKHMQDDLEVEQIDLSKEEIAAIEQLL